MQYVLETDALTKKYRNFTALKGLSMHIPKGAIYGFVGRNGAGKTTLIRLICGLQEPSSGSYTLYGASNSDSTIGKSRRRMGAVVESPSIYMDMTARDNIKEQYQVLGLPSEHGIDELLQLVGLADTGKKKAKNFSLGMRQRLGIAVALAGNPDFLVLDEPVNGLDPQGIIEMRELILKLNHEKGITVLISKDLVCDEDVKIVLYILAESVAARLRENGFRCRVVEISVRDNELFSFTRQKKIDHATNITGEIAAYAYQIFKENYNWSKPIRSVGVRGADLVTDNYWEQIDLFSSVEKREKQMKMDSAVDEIRRRFGFYSIQRGLMYRDRILSAVNAKEEHTVHPHGYFG